MNNITEDAPVQSSVTNTDAYLLRDNQNGITTLTLNRPQEYNVLSEEMLNALSQELTQIAQDDTVRVVILAATGKAFCSGHNLKQMRSQPERDYHQQLFTLCSLVMQQILRLPQPVIAKVQGLATAAGCQLVATCDMVVAVDTASFATSGIRLGLFCSTPAVAVSRNLPTKQALEMLLTGDFMPATTAVQYGLINYAVPADQLDNKVNELAQAIIAKSAIAVKIGKQMFYQQLDMPIAQAYEFASCTMADNMMTNDAKEGINAFIEKRHPVWTGQ